MESSHTTTRGGGGGEPPSVPIESLYGESYRQRLREGTARRGFQFGWYTPLYLPVAKENNNNQNNNNNNNNKKEEINNSGLDIFFPPFSELMWEEGAVGEVEEEGTSHRKHDREEEEEEEERLSLETESQKRERRARRRREAGFDYRNPSSIATLWGGPAGSDRLPPAEDYRRALWGKEGGKTSSSES